MRSGDFAPMKNIPAAKPEGLPTAMTAGRRASTLNDLIKEGSIF
jgi:hypothetical protein